MREALRNAHPIVQLLILVGIGVAAMCLLLFLALIPFYFAGYDLMSIGALDGMSSDDTAQVFMLKVMQIAQAIGLFISPYLVYRFVVKDNTYTLESSPTVMRGALLFLATVFCAFPLISFLAEWNAGLSFPIDSINQWMHETEANAERLIKIFLHMDSVGDLMFNLVLIAFVPAIGEEMLFRGTMQPIFLRYLNGNHHLAIWITAFIFSFIHLQFLGFFPRFLLGALLGYAAHWSGSLWAPMFGHFANNALAVLLAYIVGVETLDSDAELLGEGMSWVYAIPSLLLVGGGMWLLYRNRLQVNG